MTMRCRVLLVDDDPALQRLIAESLPSPGFETRAVCDGAEALSALRESEFDIILLDLMLPRVNGFEILRDLKSRDEAMLERTIVVTAASDLTLAAFDRNQVFRLLRKPFLWSAILCAIQDCMDSQQKSRQGSLDPETIQAEAAKCS